MASLSMSNARIGVKENGQQDRKRGRPRIQSNSDAGTPDDKIAQRRERVRLAQRAYRNRRDTKVDDLKERVAKLERALEKIMDSFTRFQNSVIGVENLPPKIALDISRTALDIASAARQTQVEEPFRDTLLANDGPGKLINSEGAGADAEIMNRPKAGEVWPNEAAKGSSTRLTSVPASGSTSLSVANSSPPVDFPFLVPPQNLAARRQEIEQGTWFTTLLLQLCSEQGVQLLTSPSTTFDDLHPALSIHLTWVTVDQLREQCLRARSTNFKHIHEDPEQLVIFGSPSMYRSIEGSDDLLVPRTPSLEPQQLIQGRTRTKLGTSLLDFQGEWLEPIDVQEYLECQGIFLGSGGQGGVLQISIPESTLQDIWTHDANAIFTEEIQRSRVIPMAWPFAIESRDTEARLLREATIEVEEYQAATIARHHHIPDASIQEQYMVTQSVHEQQTQNTSARYSLRNEIHPYTPRDSLISITLHLDRLMRFLVTAACCIGSGPGVRKEAVEHALRLSISKY